MKKKNFVLSKEQQDLVTNNHNLIYTILNKYHYPEDEYYDLAALGLCQAAHNYNPEKGLFSTYACNVMRYNLFRYIELQTAKHRIPKECIVSYDKSITGGNIKDSSEVDFLDIYNDGRDIESEIIAKVDFDRFYEKQTEKNKKVMDLLAREMSLSLAAKEYGCSKSYIQFAQNALKKKYHEACSY